MPYGIPKNLGGDSKENIRWLETVARNIMDKGYSQEEAIRICKEKFIEKKGNKTRASIAIVNYLLDRSSKAGR